MGAVNLSAVGKTYAGGVQAVEGVTFDVPDGSFCVLVGPSGCGKSTLLRMVAGLETITSGTVSIGGRVVNAIEPSERDIAMVFQNYALYPHFSVYDNMAYGLRNRRTPKAEIDRRVREAARILALEPYLNRRPRELSGGQRQRVAMGRAIVRKPQVFLFDEPLSNLDAKLRVQMRVEIKRLQRSLGVTSIYVTHDQVEAMTLSDQLVVMNGGHVEQVGPPTLLYTKPASRFVAGFLGSPAMGFVPGRWLGDGGVEVEGRTIGGVRPDAPPSPGTAVFLGLRPEAMTLVPSGTGRMPFAVEFAEELGAVQLVHGQAAGANLTVQVSSGSAPPSGDMDVAFPAEAAHLFDALSDKRL